MATRAGLTTASARVARDKEKDLCWVAEFLVVAKENGSKETSEDFIGTE